MKSLMSIVMATAVLLSTTSCGDNIPVEGIVYDEPFEGQTYYVNRTIMRFEQALDLDLSGMAEPTIGWVYEDQCDIGFPSITWNEGCYRGLAFSTFYSCDIILALTSSLQASSLAHEIGHCLLNHIHYKDGDPDHTHPEVWKVIREVR